MATPPSPAQPASSAQPAPSATSGAPASGAPASGAPASGISTTLILAWGALCLLAILAAGFDLAPHLRVWLAPGELSAEDIGRTELVVSACSRFLATSLSMLVALCALALPLTANVYTPRLIELFLADRLNRVVLVFFVVANGVVLWNAFMISADTSSARPRALLSVGTTLAAVLVIAPYFLYVLRFLLPQTIVARLSHEVRRDYQSLVNAKEGAIQEAVTNVQYIGKVTLRSIQRYDRDVASEGLHALEELFKAYLEVKAQVPPTELPTSTRDALGLGPELAQDVVRKDAIIEVAILQELSLLLPIAISSGVGEVVSQIAALTRRCGVAVAARQDDRVEELVTLYFNTFLRSALKARNAEAFYKICYQYRRFATDLLALDPALSERVTFFLDYYAHQAVRMNLPFLINVVAYDLAALCEEAYERSLPGKGRFLDAFIALDRDLPGILDMPGVVKAQIILAARLRTRGDTAASDQLVIELEKVSPDALRETFGEIVAARDQEHFWEIADRRRHLDHVEPEFRPAINELREVLLGPQSLGVATLLFLDRPEDIPAGRARPLREPASELRPAPATAPVAAPSSPAPSPPAPSSPAPSSPAPSSPAPSSPAPSPPAGAGEGSPLAHQQGLEESQTREQAESEQAQPRGRTEPGPSVPARQVEGGRAGRSRPTVRSEAPDFGDSTLQASAPAAEPARGPTPRAAPQSPEAR